MFTFNPVYSCLFSSAEHHAGGYQLPGEGMIRLYSSRLVFVIPESSIEEGLSVELGCKVEVVS